MVIVVILFHLDVPTSDCMLTIQGLTLLEEGAGIPILQQIQTKKSDFLRKLRIRQNTPLNNALETWLTKPVPSHIKPTWTNLCYVLRLMDLEPLVNKIEDYLSLVTKSRSSNLVTAEQHHIQDHCSDHQSVVNQSDIDECLLSKQKYYASVFYQNRTVHTQSVLIHFSVIQQRFYVS